MAWYLAVRLSPLCIEACPDDAKQPPPIRGIRFFGSLELLFNAQRPP